jgi:hypothetical protein
MKTRTFVSILVVALVILIIAGSCATKKKTYISSDLVLKELVGTWYNEEYENPSVEPAPKVIVNTNGTLDFFKEFAETSMITHIEAELVEFNDQWTDAKGSVWYEAQFFIETFNYTYYEFGKIGDEGQVWTLVWSNTEYPTDIDKESLNYRIYYRKE